MTERPDVDPRLRAAVDASIGWYDDLCALHGVDSMLGDGLWSSLRSPPPLHSDAVVVEPPVDAEQVLARLTGRARCGVKDSFATVDLSGAGFEVLFSATWIHRDAARAPSVVDPPPGGWVVVTGAEELAEWNRHHDTAGVLLPALLGRAHFLILAKHEGDRSVAGAVARLGSGVVDVSNVWAVPGHSLDWAELAEAVGALLPGRALVGYERGDALRAALAGGFVPVGELRVWVR